MVVHVSFLKVVEHQSLARARVYRFNVLVERSCHVCVRNTPLIGEQACARSSSSLQFEPKLPPGRRLFARWPIEAATTRAAATHGEVRPQHVWGRAVRFPSRAVLIAVLYDIAVASTAGTLAAPSLPDLEYMCSGVQANPLRTRVSGRWRLGCQGDLLAVPHCAKL